MQQTLLLIDLMPILYRGHFIFLSKPRRTTTGMNTSALSVFASTIERLLKCYKPTHIAIAAESQTPTFRHTLYPPYKAQREKMPEDIAAAIGQATELAKAWGIEICSVEGYEADDILGTLATEGVAAGMDVIIASPDKDLGQLAGPHVLISNNSNEPLRSAEEICAQWDIPSPDNMIDYLALAGDASDNIPGLPGVGPKTAAKLIREWGSVENLIAHAHEVPGKNGEKLRAHMDELKMSYKLVTIVRDVPHTFTLDDLAVKPLNPQALAPLLAKYELKTIATHLGIALESVAAPTVAAPADDLFAFAEQQAHPSPPTSAPVASTQPAAPESALTGEPLLSGPSASIQTHPHTYTLVTTAAEREALAQRLLQAPMVAFDTETTGLSTRHDRAVGCSFAIQGSEAWYVALPDDDDAQREALAPFLPLFTSKTIIKVGHHLRFDRAVLLRLGIEMEGPLHDTLLAYYLLDATVPHDLDHAAKVFLNYQTIPISNLIGKGKNALTMDALTPEQILDYAAEDADIAYRLHEALWPQLEAQGLLPLLETCEQPLANVLLAMESVGVKIDLEALHRYRRELEGEILKLEMAIREVTGAGINLASSKQLGEFLFGTLKLDEAAKRTPSGQYKTDEEQLLKIRDRHPIVDQILDWRGCVKLKNTYVEKLPLHIDPMDGRVHTTFNQTFTDTGRLSSSNPNLQNIPIRTERGQRIRAAFVARAPGWSILSADYSQVELRLMAAMSKDEQMIQAFLEGQDIHAQTAAVVYGVPLEAVTPQQRSHCKMVNFGIIYGISAFGLASRLRIQRREAQHLIDAYFANYPAVKAYMDQMIESAREKGYAETLFGRRRPIADIHSRNGATRAAAERIAINMPIQGTAADIIKFAMVNLQDKLRAHHLQTQITLQIHDELLFDVPDEERDVVIPLIRDTMENVCELAVPLKVSMGIGADWLAAH